MSFLSKMLLHSGLVKRIDGFDKALYCFLTLSLYFSYTVCMSTLIFLTSLSKYNLLLVTHYNDSSIKLGTEFTTTKKNSWAQPCTPLQAKTGCRLKLANQSYRNICDRVHGNQPYVSNVNLYIQACTEKRGYNSEFWFLHWKLSILLCSINEKH